MNRTSFQSILLCAGVLLLAATLSAQGGGQGAAQGRQGGAPAGAGRQGGGGGGATNLTVLPRDIPQPQLIQIMQAFETALGVECDHCHVYQGRGNPANNLASDDKPAKKTARLMMTMVRDFNAKLISDAGKPVAQLTQVQCGTCHRGSAIPKYTPPAPAAAPAAPGGGRQGGGRQGGA